MSGVLYSSGMVQLLNQAWRHELADMASVARRSMLVAAPFIKYEEARWLCKQLRPGIEVITLTTIDADAVSALALDLTALRHLAEVSPSATLFALPNLHAKVFVIDEKAAIITSGNLTRSSLDTNIEYGVLLRKTELVRTVRKDMLSFARLGSRVDANTIAKLIPLETDLRQARVNIASRDTPTARRMFDKIMRQIRPQLTSLQVGDRSAHAVFGDAIQFVLAHGPQTTQVIERTVSALMPTLCDESKYFIIKGERYGKEWKRRLRHAQLHLKRKGVVTYNSNRKTWMLTQP